MQGKVCLITGATSGVGEAAAMGLARLGAEVVVAGRNPQRAAATVARIKARTGNDNLSAIIADLQVMSGVRQLAQAFRERHARLDVLVNNAGAFFFRRDVTAEGLERTFALNHLNYFLLTNLLLDKLREAAPARIINVASSAQFQGRIDFDNLQLERGYSGVRAYAQSKLANVLFTYELARRLNGSGVTANALHPGFVRTRIGSNNGLIAGTIARLIFLRGMSPEKGADTIVHLASSPDLDGVTGKYFVRRRAVSSAAASYEEGLARRLWEVSEELVGIGD